MISLFLFVVTMWCFHEGLLWCMLVVPIPIFGSRVFQHLTLLVSGWYTSVDGSLAETGKVGAGYILNDLNIL